MTLSRFVICSYSTFCSYPPEVVKEMPKEVLVKEVIFSYFCNNILVYMELINHLSSSRYRDFNWPWKSKLKWQIIANSSVIG
jgi:hypothetical protein